MSPLRQQQTICQAVSVEGRGYWSGQPVRVEFRPAPEGSGIRFRRDDLSPTVSIPVNVALRQSASRRTVLSVTQDGVTATVDMIEHVVATLSGLAIDNCEIGVTAPEMPGSDGSAQEFVLAIDTVGIKQQTALVEPLIVEHPVRCGDENQWVEARPAIGDGLTIEYSLNYSKDPVIGQQWRVTEVNPESFRDELAPARTFLLKREADALAAQGVGGHVTPQDLLIFDEQGPVENSLRYEDECVRHKTLDVVGDLALAGRPLIGHVVAYRSGHQLNAELVQRLLDAHSQQQPQRRSA